MPHLKHLCVLGIAEPFWKDAAFKIMEKLDFQKYKHQCEFRANTNGICLNEKVATKFFSLADRSDISWSIDAATAVTHRKIRRLDSFDLVLENLRRWIRMRGEHHKVSIYNNINMLNVHEMSQMVEIAADVGVDSITLLPTHDQTGVVQLGELVLCEKNLKLFKEESERALETASRIGINKGGGTLRNAGTLDGSGGITVGSGGFAGAIAELINFSRVLTADERAQVRRGLADHYRIKDVS